MRLITFVLLFFALQIQAATLTITPNGTAGTVTAGIPFAACALTSTDNFKLVNEVGTEVPIFIKPTLMWPASKCNGASTVRAVKIQFAYTPTWGTRVYNWQLSARSLPAIPEQPIAETVSANPARAPYKEPAFFAINDPAYLVTTGLIPPTIVAGPADYDTKWFPTAFNIRKNQINFKTTIGSGWLFDAVSTIYQQALRTGNVEHYREAYLEHEFYYGQMDVVTFDKYSQASFKLAPSDIKYIYLTPMKLHIALTGDDSWTPLENGVTNPKGKDRATFIKTIAEFALNSNAVGNPYTNTASRFTERESGFALQQLVAAYELTNDPVILTSIVKVVENFRTMVASNPDGLGNHGYMSHSWDAHEGDYPAYIGMTPVFTGSPESTQNFTTVTLRNSIGDDYKKMKAGSQVFFKPYGPVAKLAEDIAKNADGTLSLKLTAPAAIRSNQFALFQLLGDKNTRAMNFASDRIVSPWMQAIPADGLWQMYSLSDDAELKAKIAALLLGFGEAVASYGIDGTGLKPALKTQLETAFNVSITSSTASGSRGLVPYARYVGNYLMSGAPASYIDYMMYDGSFSDQHTSEALFTLSLAIRFEANAAKKAAMIALGNELMGWFKASNTPITYNTGHETRYFSWTNKYDTPANFYLAVNGPSEPPVIPPVIPPVEPPVVIPPVEPPVVVPVSELDKAKTEIVALKAQVATLTTTVTQLLAEKTALATTNAGLVTANGTLTVTVADLQGKVTAAGVTLTMTQERLSRAEANITTLEGEYQELETHDTATTVMLEATEQELEQLQQPVPITTIRRTATGFVIE